MGIIIHLDAGFNYFFQCIVLINNLRFCVMKALHILCLLFVSFICTANSSAIDLSTNKWKLWLDRKAPVEANASGPSCGWINLFDKGIYIEIPATVEEYFWGG